jgi:hypothetical protein
VRLLEPGDHTSVPMKALVAVGIGDCAVFLQVFPSEELEHSPWRTEFGCGSTYPDDVMPRPKEEGLWIWEGILWYPGPNLEGVVDDGPDWRGTWRRPDLDELGEYLESLK